MPDDDHRKDGDDLVGYGNYEIGYRKPPRNTRFRKGRSGNPTGRPRGSNNLDTLLGKELTERIHIRESGRRRTITKLAAIVKQQVNCALSGDRAAAKFVIDQIRENKQSIALFPTGPDGRPQIPIEIVRAVVDALLSDADEVPNDQIR